MDGIIIINKEKNMTSRDVVNIACKKLGTKKIGHTGTLDPIASGVLVLAVNKGLKIVEDILALDKEYIAEVTIGIMTDTLDITGNVLKREKPKNIERNSIVKVLNLFKGKYQMEVPIYSAIKVNGKKLYEYARNNESIILPIKEVYIKEIELLDDIIYLEDTIKFKFRCVVSKGTYIRSLIRDICTKLNQIGTMSDLIRIRQGKFKIEDAIKIEDLNDNFNIIKMKDAVDLPLIEIDESLFIKVKNGMKLENIYDYNKFGFIYKNELVAIYVIDKDNNKIVRAKKVFVN